MMTKVSDTKYGWTVIERFQCVPVIYYSQLYIIFHLFS